MNNGNTAWIVVGLQFGDEGKGTITDALSRRFRSNLTVRYSGSAQAAHHVHGADGRKHCFSQFGSGTFAGARTLLSGAMTINPVTLLNEADHLRRGSGIDDIMQSINVDARLMVITPFHRIMNHARETWRGAAKHGSCGAGVGEQKAHHLKAPWQTIYAGELEQREVVIAKLEMQRAWFRNEIASLNTSDGLMLDGYIGKLAEVDAPETAEFFYCIHPCVTSNAASMIAEAFHPVFEGSQGVLLDELYGFFPYTTWSDTTPRHAYRMLTEAGWANRIHTTGVARTYLTRHGAGPMPTESIEAGALINDDDNQFGQWQGHLRAGWMDTGLLRYAVDCCRTTGGIDSMSITHADKLQLLEWHGIGLDRLKMPNPATLTRCEDTIPYTKAITTTDDVELIGRNAGCSVYPNLGSIFAHTRRADQIIPEMLGHAKLKSLIVSHGKTAVEKDFQTWTTL